MRWRPRLPPPDCVKVLICCDHPAGFTPDKDTTRAIIESGWTRGHAIHWVDKSALAWFDGAVQAHAQRLEAPGPSPDGWYSAGVAQWTAAAGFDAVLVRSDPPVDLAYQRMCQLLALLPPGKVWNSPQALLTHNEKLSALHFAHWMVDSIVANDDNVHAHFAKNHPKGVAKSLDSLGGEGVVAWGGSYGSAAQAHARAAGFGPQAAGRALTMGQSWIREVYAGDKRVIMVGGNFAGVIVRVPQAGEFRGNIHLGGQVEATTLTERERAIVADVGPWLRREGIVLAGLDLVGECLTEINITSPTGFREIERLTPDRPSLRFWEAVEGHNRT